MIQSDTASEPSVCPSLWNVLPVSIKGDSFQSLRASLKTKFCGQDSRCDCVWCALAIMCVWNDEHCHAKPLVGFMYLVFTRVPGESYSRRLRSLLLCYVFLALINSLVCWLNIAINTDQKKKMCMFLHLTIVYSCTFGVGKGMYVHHVFGGFSLW